MIEQLEATIETLTKSATEKFNTQSKRIEAMEVKAKEITDRCLELEQKASYRPEYDNFKPNNMLVKNVIDDVQAQAFANRRINKAGIEVKSMDLLTKNTTVNTGNQMAAAQRGDIISGAYRKLFVASALPMMTANSNAVEFTRQTAFTNNAAPQAGEGALKAESAFTFELLSVPIQTIAHFVKASRQVLSDSVGLMQFFDTTMRYGLNLELDDQIINGNGVGNNFTGMIANGTEFNGSLIAGSNKLEMLRQAITQVQQADFEADTIILNPADWGEIEATREGASSGTFIFGMPNQSAAPLIWGAKVIVSNSLAAGKFIVADMPAGAALMIRDNAMVEFFEQDADNVQKNLVTIRAELRAALVISRPQAIVVGNF